MAKKPKNTEYLPEEGEKEQNGTDTTKNMLGALLNGHQEDIFNHIENKPYHVSTGSLFLDGILGGKGVSTGSSIRLLGPHSSGKTSQAMLLMHNYLQTVPESRGIYVKSEFRLSEELKERSGLKFVTKAEEWDTGTVFILESNIFEAIASTLEGILRTMFGNGQHLCCIWDSLDMCILRNDLREKSISDGTKVAGIPLMTKLLYRRLGFAINKYNALMILISQASASIQVNPYGGKDASRQVNASGGAAASHCMDIILEYTTRYNKHLILEDDDKQPHPVTNKILGHKCPIIIRKSTNEADNISLELSIKHGQRVNSFWKSKEICETLIQWELCKKSGKTFTFADDIIKQAKEDGIELPDKIVGMNKLYCYFDENENICDWFYKKFKNLIG